MNKHNEENVPVFSEQLKQRKKRITEIQLMNEKMQKALHNFM